MKKIFALSFAAAALLGALASCNKENAPVSVVQTKAKLSVIDTPFSAVLPSAQSSAGTGKTSVNLTTGAVTWLTDDPVLVSNGTESQTMYIKTGGGTSSPLYTHTQVLTGDAFWAVYPAENSSYEGGVFTCVIPTNQTFVAGGFATETFPMVAACGADRSLAFKNAASLLRIIPSTTAYAGATITSVSVSADQKLAGIINVNYQQGFAPVISCIGTESVTLGCPDPVAFGTPIHVVVAPGSYTGVKVTLRLSNGLVVVHDAGAVQVDRSKYATIAFQAADTATDLSAAQTANCYMITQPGSYKFRATVKGNGVLTSYQLPTAISNIASIKAYYSDGSTFLDGTFTYLNGYVYFTTVGGTLPTGTMLVSALDASGTTLWSWHLWSNPAIADVTLSDGSVWQNMNLGAHQVEANSNGFNGYYYQWGRKDPFQQAFTPNTASSEMFKAPFVSHASMTDGSLANSIKNPAYFYGGYQIVISGTTYQIHDWCTFEDNVKYYDWWNKNATRDNEQDLAAGKTMFDPCPPGYHVPTYKDFNTLVSLGAASRTKGTSGTWVEDKLFFPYVSSRGAGISWKYWIGYPESTDGKEGERGFYQTATPYSTGDKSSRTVHRLWSRNGSLGITTEKRSLGMVVRCKKD